jgi:hypothetical protein
MPRATSATQMSTNPSYGGISKRARANLQLEKGKTYFHDNQHLIFERYGEDNRLVFKLRRTELTFRIDWTDSRSDLPTNEWVIAMIAAGRFKTDEEYPAGTKSSRFMMSEEEATELDPGAVIRHDILCGLDKLGRVSIS